MLRHLRLEAQREAARHEPLAAGLERPGTPRGYVVQPLLPTAEPVPLHIGTQLRATHREYAPCGIPSRPGELQADARAAYGQRDRTHADAPE